MAGSCWNSIRGGMVLHFSPTNCALVSCRKARESFVEKRYSQRIQISVRDSNRSKISPRRTQRKTIKSLAAVNSVSSVVRFRFSNRGNPSQEVSRDGRCRRRRFSEDICFLLASLRARTEQCFCPCRVMKPLALDPENEKSHLAFRIFYPGILRA